MEKENSKIRHFITKAENTGYTVAKNKNVLKSPLHYPSITPN